MKRREFMQFTAGALVLTAIDGKLLLFGEPPKLQAANNEFIGGMSRYRAVEFPYRLNGNAAGIHENEIPVPRFNSIRVYIPVDESGNFKASLTEVVESAHALIDNLGEEGAFPERMEIPVPHSG